MEKPSRNDEDEPVESPATTVNDPMQQQQHAQRTDGDNKPDAADEPLDLTRTISSSVADNLSLPREILFIGIICTAQFTTQVGLGQALSLLHIVGAYFGIENSPGNLSWLISGYSLTVGSFILIAGRFGDVFGYKRMLIIGYSWFALWTLVAGLSYYSNHVLFVFARVLQGIGPAICVPNGLAILGATYRPSNKKNMIFALFGACAPGGAVTGVAFGALFGQIAHHWPWTFYSFAITLAIVAVVGVFVIPDPQARQEAKPLGEKIRQLDLVGGFLGITALILINFAWNQSGVVTWHKPYVYVLLIIGILLVPVFFWWEQTKATNPLLPYSIFTVEICFVLALIALGWGSFGVFVYYAWNFLVVIRGITPMLASAMFAPVAVSGFIASITTGILLSQLRPAWVMTVALSAFLAGNLLVGLAPVHQTYWGQFFVCTLVITFGMDMSFPAGTIIISDALPKDRQGMGASLIATIVNYSIALALGFAGTVEGNVADGDVLRGYHGAFYMGFGLAGAGLCLSLVFLARSYIIQGRERRKEASEKV